MDFALSNEQHAVVDLSQQIFSDLCTQERLREIEETADRFDGKLWAELARADLVGLTLPTDVGGGGFGFLELCLLLAEQGRSVAHIPLVATIASTALPIAAFGTDEQCSKWLPGVVAGETLMTAALNEPSGSDPREPSVLARPIDGGWEVSGVKTMVPTVGIATAILVPATTPSGDIVVLIAENGIDGLSVTRQDTFSHEPAFELSFNKVVLDASAQLGGPGADGRKQLDWIVDRATIAICAIASGVADAGLRLTASYATERHQFDRPIGSFQAVGHRLADCFIDNEAIRLSMLYAASLLAEGHDAGPAISVAKYWASFGGRRVGHAALHVHGGISIDLDYPVHRYFLWAKQLENTLGAAGPQLDRIGELIAEPSTPA